MRKPARVDPKWEAARCNDGTPFAYEIRRGKSSEWLINLTGGWFCDDEAAPCAERARRLTTTLPGVDGAPTRMKAVGIFSPDPQVNPTFHDATHVDAHYCSSDLWFGDRVDRRPTTGSAEGWYFSGRENVRVLLEALRELEGLDPADPDTRILLLGTSAGAAGVAGNLDQVAAAWPEAVAERRVHVVLDAGWVTPPADGKVPADAARWGPPEPACVAAGIEPRRCVLGPVWWPFAVARGMPVLVQISGLDLAQTPVFGVDTPEEQQAWRARVKASLEEAGVPWVYSSGQPYHVVAIEERWDKGSPSLRDLVERFWRGDPPERVFLDY